MMYQILVIYIYIYVRSSTIDRRCSCFSASSDRPRDDRSGLGCRLQSKPTDICIAVSPLFNVTPAKTASVQRDHRLTRVYNAL